MRNTIKNILNFLTFIKRKDVSIGKNVSPTGSSFEGKNKIYNNTIFIRSQLGLGSYIGSEGKFSNTTIGRFCSIGNRVKIVQSMHPSNTFVSTHPAFFSLAKQGGYTYAKAQIFNEFKFLNEETKIAVAIGNDVWIGDEVMILGGVKIHDGAIIGSKALVTKDVAPYSIVGGVPAKVIGTRFTSEEIEFLLHFKWWDNDESWISENAYLFSDIKQFIITTQNIKG